MKKTPRSSTELDALEWKDYVGERSIARHPGKFFVIKPKDYQQPQPLFCQVCSCLISTIEDVNSQESHDACLHCVEKWYYPNAERWKNGWRPDNVECSYKKTITIG